MQRAFVFGNVAVDEVIEIAEFPSTGQSVLGRTHHLGTGGKGANQAVILARTGVPTCLVAVCGEEAHGQMIRTELARETLSCDLITREGHSSDRSVILTRRGGENLIVTTQDCALSLTWAECRPVLMEARPGDLVLLQGNLAPELNLRLAQHCSAERLQLVLNPSPFTPTLRALLPHAHTVFANQDEARALTGLERREATAALRQAGVRCVVLTMGRDGALLDTGSEVTQVPALSARGRDVSGAGDCFEGVALGSAILRGCALDPLALSHAARAAARVVEKAGTISAFPEASQLRRILQAGP